MIAIMIIGGLVAFVGGGLIWYQAELVALRRRLDPIYKSWLMNWRSWGSKDA